MVVNFKKAVLTVCAFCIGVGLVAFSEGVRNGVSDSIELCISTVIPSLFLFTALAVFFVKSGSATAIGRVVDPFSRVVFCLSGEQFAVMTVSFVSGYPVGARLINELYLAGRATASQAQRMLDFCVCGGPAFIVLAVGEATLGSHSDGVRLLAAHIASAVIMALASRLLAFGKNKASLAPTPQSAPEAKPLSLVFTLSVTDAARSMFGISAFVIAFGGLGGMLSSLEFLAPCVTKTLIALSEVTVGVGQFGRKELPTIAFLLGFGGISVHFQVLSAVSSLRFTYPRLLLSRTVHGTLSAILIALFESVSPRVINTAVGSTAPSPRLHGSPFAVAALLLMGAVLIFYSSDAKASFFRKE